MLSDTASPVAVGDVYCVTAHPYIRWTVVAVKPRPDGEAEVVLQSSADPAVNRTVGAAVLHNPLRFTRVAAE
ncbi:MAG TPA: hypothetical protein VGB82_28180 [Alphaproteobacteria bacterium]